MQRLLLALAVSALLLAGCRSLPMATNADSVEQLKYKQDSYQCVKETRDKPSIAFNMNMYRACIEARGYTF